MIIKFSIFCSKYEIIHIHDMAIIDFVVELTESF